MHQLFAKDNNIYIYIYYIKYTVTIYEKYSRDQFLKVLLSIRASKIKEKKREKRNKQANMKNIERKLNKKKIIETKEKHEKILPILYSIIRIHLQKNILKINISKN